jgi:hypothetical protein
VVVDLSVFCFSLAIFFHCFLRVTIFILQKKKITLKLFIVAYVLSMENYYVQACVHYVCITLNASNVSSDTAH